MDKAEQIAAIIGITEAIKQYGVPSSFCPTLAIIVGALMGYANKPTSQGILEGIVMGATTTGGYAVIKNSAGGMLKKTDTSKNPRTDYAALEPEDYRGI